MLAQDSARVLGTPERESGCACFHRPTQQARYDAGGRRLRVGTPTAGAGSDGQQRRAERQQTDACTDSLFEILGADSVNRSIARKTVSLQSAARRWPRGHRKTCAGMRGSEGGRIGGRIGRQRQRQQAEAAGTGSRQKEQAEGADRGSRHRQQAQAAGTGSRHRQQAQGAGTGSRHREQAQGAGKLVRGAGTE